MLNGSACITSLAVCKVLTNAGRTNWKGPNLLVGVIAKAEAEANTCWKGPLLCVGVIAKAKLLDITVSPANVALPNNVELNAPVIATLLGWSYIIFELSVGEKPAYDLLICDKTKRIEEI